MVKQYDKQFKPDLNQRFFRVASPGGNATMIGFLDKMPLRRST